MYASGYSQVSISKLIGVHKSTVSRELSRNTPRRGRNAGKYEANRAQTKAKVREQTKPKHFRFESWMLTEIRYQIKEERWSPAIISVKGKEKYGDFISHETIYQYIWAAKRSSHKDLREDKELCSYLRHHSRRQKRKNTNGNRGCIPNRVSIDQRPSIVSKRTRQGDIEVDLMMGKNHKPGLIVLTDRTTLETQLIKTTSKKANDIERKIVKRLRSRGMKLHTLTFDNDLAFSRHEHIGKALGVSTYFTRPYTSQDKGTVENRIGIIRRFFPKGTDMEKVHHKAIEKIERKLNNRPVKKFNYLSPLEMKYYLTKVALVT